MPFDDKVKGYRYGREFVPISTYDESALKLQSDACVRLLGFIYKERVLRQHFMAPAMVSVFVLIKPVNIFILSVRLKLTD